MANSSNNTAEAVLTSRYVDGVSRALDKTAQTVGTQLHSMQNAMNSFSGATSSAFNGALTSIDSWRNRLNSASSESESKFKAMTLAGAAMALGLVAAFAMVSKAIIDFLLDVAREAADLTELKIINEQLSKSMGWQADTTKSLKTATEGLVGSMDLLRNSNRVMQSGAKISSDTYVELVGNVYKLAKGARVDATQALNTLTDAIIRGNARGFQQIGIQLNVKDAISEMALAAGHSTNTMASAAKMQAFYKELLEQTRQAVAKTPKDFFSLEDAILKSEKTWRSWIVAIGEGVNRSAVFQELLQKLSQNLDNLGSNKSMVEGIALSVNQAMISMLNTASATLRVLASIGEVVNLVAVPIRFLTDLVRGLFYFVSTGFGAMVTGIFQMLASIPGPAQKYFGEVAATAKAKLDSVTQSFNNMANNLKNPLRQFSDLPARMSAASDTARNLAQEMQAFAGKAVNGADGVTRVGAAASKSEVDLKKLAQATKDFRSLEDDLVTRSLDPIAKVYNEYFKTLSKIEEAEKNGVKGTGNARREAVTAFAKDLLKATQEFNRESIEFQHDVWEIERRMQQELADVTKLNSNPNPQRTRNLGDDPAYRAARQMELDRQEELRRIEEAARQSSDKSTPDWVRSIGEAHAQLEKLNKIGMDPFKQTMAGLKFAALDFAGQAGQAFAGFFADLVSGQENAGKRLLAAFLQMIGQMLIKIGVMLIQIGTAEVVLASTWWGQILGANAAAGWRAIATGLIMTAAGGALMGAAAAMTQNSQAGASAGASGSSSSSSSPASSGPQVIRVGAPGRAQDEGSVGSAPQPQLITIKVESNDSHIVRVVKKDINNNGQLRLAVQGATA